jgi:Phosphotransferase enzyme family
VTWPDPASPAGERDELRLPGGNVGGAVLVGDTVRRQPGAWTPAVHALLEYLHDRVPCIPRVLGEDDTGREVLSYLPGQVVDGDAELLTDGQLISLLRWTRRFHGAVTGFAHAGPWRFFPVPEPTLICHNDIAPYNACFDGDQLAGVFDWDLAAPSTPLSELAFIAWNCVPLYRDIGADLAAERLTLIAASYGQFPAAQILQAVPDRITRMLDWIPVAAATGDTGMNHIMTVGEPANSRAALADMLTRIGPIAARL